jgi:hypothetical protein
MVQNIEKARLRSFFLRLRVREVLLTHRIAWMRSHIALLWQSDAATSKALCTALRGTGNHARWDILTHEKLSRSCRLTCDAAEPRPSLLRSLSPYPCFQFAVFRMWKDPGSTLQVLERGEKIEVLVDKTEDLQNQAQRFQVQGRNLRNKMWWENMKVKVCADQ